jgi:hypothetical protein
MHSSRATKFCTMGPNTCRSSIQNLLLVTLLTSGILRLCIDFWQICGPMEQLKVLFMNGYCLLYVTLKTLVTEVLY